MSYTDGTFIAPVELDGSGVRKWDDVDGSSFTLLRHYVQRAANRTRLAIGTSDYQYGAYLVQETDTAKMGEFVYFTREFMSLPSSRTEYGMTTFTFPGSSGFIYTRVPAPTQTDVNAYKIEKTWGRYAGGYPVTKAVVTRKEISFYTSQPTPDTLTLITYQGQQVDFTGGVYVETDRGLVVEGYTSRAPASYYVISSEVSRVRGNIWKKETVKVSATGGAI